MKTSYKITFLFILFSIGFANAQDKINGNRNTTTEDRNITEFTKIQIIDDFNVYLVQNENQSVSVEADSNLQKMIVTDVKDGVLTIKFNGRIGRSKALDIHLKINKDIQEILTYNSSKITSKNTVVIDSLTISSFDDSEVNLIVNSENVTFDGKNNSDLNLEIQSSSVSGRLENNCDFKGTITTKSMELNTLDKSSISVSGTSYKISLESFGNSQFKGKDFTISNAIVKANNNATIYINATENLDLYSNNASEVNVYSTPKIVLEEFYDTAVIRKKELN